MGQYIYGLTLILFLLVGYVVFHQNEMYQEHYFKAKYIAEETAASGAQFNSLVDYSWGDYSFNQTEGKKAIEYYLKTNFHLNDNFEPLVKGRGYWQDKMQYEVTFIDQNSSDFKGFPGIYSFNHFGSTHETLLNGPSVIVTVNLGKAPPNTSRLFKNDSTSIVTAIHTFED